MFFEYRSLSNCQLQHCDTFITRKKYTLHISFHDVLYLKQQFDNVKIQHVSKSLESIFENHKLLNPEAFRLKVASFRTYLTFSLDQISSIGVSIADYSQNVILVVKR